MRILVTGGAGYVGSTLVPLLLEQGHRVRVLDNLKFGGHGLLPCCQNRFFELVQGDICDPATARSAVDGMEAIIHLAAIVGYPACKKEPQLAQAVNVDGTKNLLRSAIQTPGSCSHPPEASTVPFLIMSAKKKRRERRSRFTARPRPRPSKWCSMRATP